MMKALNSDMLLSVASAMPVNALMLPSQMDTAVH